MEAFEERWYRSEQIWLAILIVIIAVAFSLVVQERRQKKNVQHDITATSAVGRQQSLPDRDISGVRDFEEIERPPDSKIIWEQESSLEGMPSRTVKYVSSRTPVEMQIFFTDKLMDRYSIIRDDLSTDEGYGWSGLFVDHENNVVVAVFSTSKRIGPPPGGESNPTEVSVMKVGGEH